MKKLNLKTMRKSSLSLLLVLLFAFNILAVDIDSEAQELYLEAMAAIGEDNESKALETFEKALFKDSKILAFDDKGLLDKITTNYLKKVTEDPKVEYYYKLGFLMRVRGNYQEAINFFNEGIKKYPENKQFVNFARKKVYELQWLLTGEKPKQEDEKDSPVANFVVAPINSEEDKKDEATSEQKAQAKTQDKEKAAEAKLKQEISGAENEVAQLQNDYDLWFSLTYGDHKYEKKDYYSAMMYFYEDKLKAAKEKLKKLQEQMDK